MRERQTLALSKQNGLQKKLAYIGTETYTLSRSNDRSVLFTSAKQTPLCHRAKNMLNSPLKRRAITPRFCHTALDLRSISLTMQLEELPDVRRNVKKEGMSPSNHCPMDPDPLFAQSARHVLQCLPP
jgi:hypothetical protein